MISPRILLYCALFGISNAAIADKNCTDFNGKYADNALSCDNLLSDPVCDALTGTTTTLVVGSDTERASKCFELSAVASEDQKQSMIKICPKTCGYCCLKQEFACKNKDFPAIDCAKVTEAQCKDAKWREIIASDCPNVCGFCLEGGCVDAAIECANDVGICRNVERQDFVKQNCKKTCGYCTNSGAGGGGSGGLIPIPGGQGTCKDSGNNCGQWRKNGFCSAPSYSYSLRKQYCAATCNLC